MLATDLIYDSMILEDFVKAKQSEKITLGKRKKETGKVGYSVSRINAMLTLIGAAYEHCHTELAGMHPTIRRNWRTAAHEQRTSPILRLKLYLRHFPDDIVRPVRVGDITCWRFWSEI